MTTISSSWCCEERAACLAMNNMPYKIMAIDLSTTSSQHFITSSGLLGSPYLFQVGESLTQSTTSRNAGPSSKIIVQSWSKSIFHNNKKDVPRWLRNLTTCRDTIDRMRYSTVNRRSEARRMSCTCVNGVKRLGTVQHTSNTRAVTPALNLIMVEHNNTSLYAGDFESGGRHHCWGDVRYSALTNRQQPT